MKFDKFVIECAPSIGAIMTACLIAQELDHSSVKVTSMLSGSDRGHEEFACTSPTKRRAQKQSFLSQNTNGSRRLTTLMDLQRSRSKLNGTGNLGSPLMKAQDELQKPAEITKCETQEDVEKLKKRYKISDKIDLQKFDD